MNVSRAPYRSIPVGVGLLMLARTLIILVPIVVLIQFADSGSWGRSSGTAVVICLALLVGVPAFLGPFLVQLGARIASPDARDAARQDPRPPVLFLRPFSQDSLRRTAHDLKDDDDFGAFGNLVATDEVQSVRRILKGYFATEDLSLEQEVGRALSPIGPMVAIGRPGESIQTAGAMRMYVSDEEWKDAVESLLRSASAVIWQAGTSTGTWWELEKIVSIVDPRRVVLLIPSPVQRADAYEDLWQRAREVLPVGLPRVWDDVNIITFDGKWNPTAHPFVYYSTVEKFFMPSGLNLLATLAPFIRKLPKESVESEPRAPWTSAKSLSNATLWIAPFLAVGLAFGIDNALSDRKAMIARDEACNSLAKRIKTFAADDTYLVGPARWKDDVNAARSAFTSQSSMECAASEIPGLLGAFETRLPQSAAKLLPTWRAQVLAGMASIDDVAAALQLSGDKQLAAAWTQEGDDLRAQLLRRTIVLHVDVQQPDSVGHDTRDSVRRRLSENLEEHIRKLAGDSMAVISADKVPASELALLRRHIRITMSIAYAQFGNDKGALSEVAVLNEMLVVPDGFHAEVRFEGADKLGQKPRISIEGSLEVPQTLTTNQISRERDRAIGEIANRLKEKLTVTAIGCRDCGAPTTNVK